MSGVSEAERQDTPPPARRKVYVSKTALHWLVEGTFIVAGVALGFAVAEYGERRQERQLAARVLQGLRDEIAHNITQLEPALAKHLAWQDNISAWFNENAKQKPTSDLAARDAFITTMPGVPDINKLNLDNFEPPFPVLRAVAWDTAVSTGALRLIDYDVTASLSEIYSWQAGLPAIPTDDTDFFDPARVAPATLRTSFAMDALIIAENTLLKLYKKHLPAVRAAAESAG
jgi:hypothetical protein